MSKILLIGKKGQVGQELEPLLSQQGELIALGKDQLDLSNSEQIQECIAHYQPNLIINAGAYTAVDQAETETKLAYAVNSEAPKILAEGAEKIGARLFHISTDYVFDGSKSHPYTEADQTNPIGVYGKSKLAGEMGIKNNCQDYIILRTAWVYGVYGKGNFVKTMLKLGRDREELKIVSDQVGTPTWSNDIAKAIIGLITKLPASPVQEIYHFTNSGVASWYDLGVAIFEEAKVLNIPLKVHRIFPISTAEYPTAAKRPSYSVLSGKKIGTILETHPPQWRVSLREMLTQFKSQNL